MSGDDWEPWTFTAWGEDTLEERQALRALHEGREQRLRELGVDPRLVDYLWRVASERFGELLPPDPRDVAWLDRLVVQAADADSVPLCTLDPGERGVVARPRGLFEVMPGSEQEVDTSWVWEELLRDGLARWQGDDEARQELLAELGLVGGPALLGFAEGALNRPR